MFEKILYPTDFSDVSKKALEYCKKLKEAGTKEIIVVHVIEWDPNVESMPQNMKAEFKKLLELEPRKGLDLIKSELIESGLDVRIRLERGSPFKEILKVESEEGVSAIVIGSHGKSNIKEMVMGSVSENVVRRSRSPVLVVKR